MRNKCDICGKEFEGFGNNPAPLDGNVCCDECNAIYVIPARLKKLNINKTLGDASIETPQITELRKRVGYLLSEEVNAINDYDDALKTVSLSEEQRKTLEEIRNDEIDHTNKLNEIYKGLMTGAVEEDLTEDASNLKESFAGGYDPTTVNTELETEPNVEESGVQDGLIETVSNAVEKIGNLSTAAEDYEQDVQEVLLKENEISSSAVTKEVRDSRLRVRSVIAEGKDKYMITKISGGNYFFEPYLERLDATTNVYGTYKMSVSELDKHIQNGSIKVLRDASSEVTKVASFNSAIKDASKDLYCIYYDAGGTTGFTKQYMTDAEFNKLKSKGILTGYGIITRIDRQINGKYVKVFSDSVIKDETVTKTVNLGRYNRYDTLVMKKANDYGLKLWGEKNVAEVTGRPEDIKLFVDFLNNHHSAGARITDSDTVNDIGEITVGSKYRFEEKYGNQPLTVTELGETVKLSLDNSKTYLRIPREKFEDMIRSGRLDNTDTTTIEQYGAVKAGDRRIGDFKSEELVNRIRTKFDKLGKDKIQQYADQLKAKGGYRDLVTRLTADLIDMTVGSSDISDWYYEFDVNDDHIMRAGKDAIKRMGIRL